LIALICTAAVIWSIRTPKTYVIQASGTVTSEKSNYVMCTYTGEITDCNLSEGMLVKDGVELFKVKSTDYNIQAQQLELSKESYQDKIEKNQLLVKSIKDDTNYFSDSDPDDVLFYSAFESYKSQVKQNTMDTSWRNSMGVIAAGLATAGGLSALADWASKGNGITYHVLWNGTGWITW